MQFKYVFKYSIGPKFESIEVKNTNKKKGVQDKQNEKSFTFQTQISFF